MNMKKHHMRAFWQADKPYLDTQTISDGRFRLLGYVMAVLAGAINAGGFFAIGHYASHVTGTLSRGASWLLNGNWWEVLIAAAAVVSFILGAAHANWTILWVKRRRGRSSYGVSLLAEAIYLLMFAAFASLSMEEMTKLRENLIMVSLCFIMGMHNTIMSVLSSSAIRSTHMTGTATDLGIEVSKLLYYSRRHHPRLPDVQPNPQKARFLAGMMMSFLSGGIIGTLGYAQIGYYFTVPVACILLIFAYGSIFYDLKLWKKWRLTQRK